jgi:hypothetical protein
MPFASSVAHAVDEAGNKALCSKIPHERQEHVWIIDDQRVGRVLAQRRAGADRDGVVV